MIDSALLIVPLAGDGADVDACRHHFCREPVAAIVLASESSVLTQERGGVSYTTTWRARENKLSIRWAMWKGLPTCVKT